MADQESKIMADQEFKISSEAEKRLVPRLSALLSRVIAFSVDRFAISPDLPDRLAAFYALSTPRITVEQYLERIYQYAGCSPSCLVIAVIYIERMIANEPGMALCMLNVHRIVVTAVMTASKFLDDVHFNNDFWARVGGVSCREMNRLELDFLVQINFDLLVSPDLFQSYYHRLMSARAADIYVPPTPSYAAEPVKPEQAPAELIPSRNFGGRRGSSDPKSSASEWCQVPCC